MSGVATAGRRRLLPLGTQSQALLACLLLSGAALGQPASELSTIEVRARNENLEGIAAAGSEGVVSGQRLASVPLLRPGEGLEMVPGLIVTQHAGDGKANQYFLRGFNLDHGTDFATHIGGVPVNMPTHAHGQGYTDLNFLIPELVDRITYRKGPYFAEEGDFSSAGSARIDYRRQFDAGIAQLTLGRNGYRRSLLADSPALADGKLLYALELFHNDGPWQVAADYRKWNGVLRYSRGSRDDGWSLSGMAYRGRWVSTDQIPQRAIDSGQLDRFGSLDPTAGGRSYRYSLSGDWARRSIAAQTRATAWVLASGLDLWSNFTYCTNGCPPGDQFKQAERRQAGGFAFSHSVFGQLGRFEVINTLGVQGRIDRLRPVGLYQAQARATRDTVREDRVTQHSLGLWLQNETKWTDWFRSVQGLRADAYDFAVDSDWPANSGRAEATMITPKLALIFGPWNRTELYANYGHGFHSNDARGATIRNDPATGTAFDADGNPVRRVSPLVRTRGAEVGIRSEILPGWQSTVALWRLDAASELLFVGDAGTTEASRPSRRQGIEWSNRFTLADWLAIDADLSRAQARFRDHAAEGRHIPGAVTTTANLGLTVDRLGPWFGTLRWRYIGPRPLVEDNSVRARPSSLVNLRAGYRFSPKLQLAFDVYNLFDRKANDIEYWYASQLSGEGAPVDDRHLHPGEPRSTRLNLLYRF